MIHYSIWSLVTLRWSGLMVLSSEAQPCPASGQLLNHDWMVSYMASSSRLEFHPLIGQLSSIRTESWPLIGQLYGLITESWTLIGQSWLPVSPRPWRKIMEAVCLILGFRMTGFNDILLLCSHFVTIITAFRSLARRGWGLGCREQTLCHGNCIDAWDPTPGLLWSCWWSLVVPPCISCDAETW